MEWGSASEFFAMGGYGFYVWGSYVVTAAFVVVEVWLLHRRKKDIQRRVARMARLNEEVNNDESA